MEIVSLCWLSSLPTYHSFVPESSTVFQKSLIEDLWRTKPSRAMKNSAYVIHVSFCDYILLERLYKAPFQTRTTKTEWILSLFQLGTSRLQKKNQMNQQTQKFKHQTSLYLQSFPFHQCNGMHCYPVYFIVKKNRKMLVEKK